ncbi:hypothetical protein T03_14946, partial [Trichinella britovi]
MSCKSYGVTAIWMCMRDSEQSQCDNLHSLSSARHLVRDYVFGGSDSLIRQGHLGKSREGWHGNLEAMRPWGSPGQGLVGGTIRG